MSALDGPFCKAVHLSLPKSQQPEAWLSFWLLVRAAASWVESGSHLAGLLRRASAPRALRESSAPHKRVSEWRSKLFEKYSGLPISESL
eukprot:79441-Chlamydomonas_euryale.AAC.1